MISFDVLGTPAPKGSWKTFHRGGRQVFLNDNPRTKPWAEAVTLAAKQASRGRILNGAVKVSMQFWLPRPKSVKRGLPSTKPDLDKLVRATLDALKGAVLIEDSRVVDIITSKRYAEDPSLTGAHIAIEECKP